MSDILGVTEAGMLNDMQKMNIISNNLANTNTVGFKRDMPVTTSKAATFENNMVRAEGDLSKSGANNNFPQLNSVVDTSSGVFKYTGNAFDIAIEGEGFLEVKNQLGTFYTRQGTMSLDAAGSLVTTGGYQVSGASGDIRLTNNTPVIDKQGKVWEGENVVAQLKMVTFSNPQNLVKIGGGLYRGENLSKSEMASSDIRIRQGYVEASNVVMMNEMVQMMEVMRHFEASQRVMKSYDDLMDNAIRNLGEF